MAGWVDDQLSPGERELMVAHLQRCESCRRRATAMADQTIAHPAVHIHPSDFWDRMDAALQDEQDKCPPEDRRVARASMLWKRVQLSPVVMLTYAAILICALGWGLYSHTTLKEARAEAASLQTELERKRRLTGQPVLASPKGYQTQPVLANPKGYRTQQNRNNRGTL